MSKANDKTLLEDMLQRHTFPRPVIRQAAKELLELIRQGLISDGAVTISKFGSFRLKPVAARRGINPRTGEAITIGAHQRVFFTPCKALRELIEPNRLPPVPLGRDVQSASTAIAGNTGRTEASANAETQAECEERGPVQAASLPRQHPIAEEGASSVEFTVPPAVREAAHADRNAPAQQERAGYDIDLGAFEITGPHRSRVKPVAATAALLFFAIFAAFLLTSNGESDKSSASATVAKSPITVKTPTPGKPTNGRDAAETGDTRVRSPATSTKAVTTATRSKPANAQGTAGEEDAQPRILATPKEILTTATSSTPRNGEGIAGAKAVQLRSQPQGDSVYFRAQRHHISHGDSLWHLAQVYYHEPLFWPHIFQANQGSIFNPNQIHVGADILIPTLQGTPAALSDIDRRHIAEGYYLVYRFSQAHGDPDAFYALLLARHYDAKNTEEQITVSRSSIN